MADKRWWISWHQPGDDYRPLTFPPNQAILGWWCSGETCGEPPLATLCAVVEALTPAKAEAAVRIDWPEAGGWRFCEERDPAWRPNDRFPLSDWMEARFAPTATSD